MASNAFANVAAATAAKYVSIELDRGASYLPANQRFSVTLEKPTSGINGQAGATMRGVGEAAVLTTARVNATAALNAQRVNKYGADSTSPNLSPTQSPGTTPSTQGTTPSHRTLTKDQD